MNWSACGVSSVADPEALDGLEGSRPEVLIEIVEVFVAVFVDPDDGRTEERLEEIVIAVAGVAPKLIPVVLAVAEAPAVGDEADTEGRRMHETADVRPEDVASLAGDVPSQTEPRLEGVEGGDVAVWVVDVPHPVPAEARLDGEGRGRAPLVLEEDAPGSAVGLHGFPRGRVRYPGEGVGETVAVLVEMAVPDGGGVGVVGHHREKDVARLTTVRHRPSCRETRARP